MQTFQITGYYARWAVRLIAFLIWDAVEPQWLVGLWALLAALDEVGDWHELLRLLRRGAQGLQSER